MFRPSVVRLPNVGDCVDRYQLVAEIAHGGMAAIYAARRADAGPFEKVIAIKFLLPHLASERRFVDMFMDEARIAAQVQHPNVVQVFDVGEHRGAPFIVMEYLRGQSLSAVLRKCWTTEEHEQRVDQGVLFCILAQAARGLAGAHDAKTVGGEVLNIVHRDVSPQNIHVSYDGHVRVVDFGIAAATGRITSTQSGEIKGKLAYLAPEQLHRRHPIDPRTDLWAFGVMCWQTFARQKLFKGETDADSMYNVINKEVPSISTLDPALPLEVARCIDACLRRSPIQRPQNAGKVAQVFERAALALDVDAAAVAVQLQRAFAGEAAQEEERVSAALRTEAPGPLKADEGSSGQTRVGQEEPVGSPASSARRKTLLAGVALAAAALLIFGIDDVLSEPARVQSEELSPPADDGIAEATPILPVADPVEVIRAETVPTVSVSVDETVARVLIDGELHDERPVLVPLPEDASSQEVIVFGPSGSRTFNIETDDFNRTLSLRRRGTMRTRMGSRRMTAQPMTAMETESPLFDVNLRDRSTN